MVLLHMTMYCALVVSDIPSILKNVQKHITQINPEILIMVTKTGESALEELEKDHSIDVVICEHSPTINAFKLYNEMCKKPSLLKPFILTTEDPDVRNAVRAFDDRMDYFIYRTRIRTDFYFELAQKIVLTCERRRSADNRQVNQHRMNAVSHLVDMRGHPFNEILDYALETSIEITGSEIGYVAAYNASTRKLTMIAWSRKALRDSNILSQPTEYDLDSAGLWGEPIRTNQSIIIDDYEADNVYVKTGLPMGHIPLKNLLMIPIHRNGIPVATAGVANKSGKYTEEDEVQFRLLINSLISIYHEKLVQEDNLRNENLLKEILETPSYGIILLGKDHRIKACNRYATDVLSIPPAVSQTGYLTDLLDHPAVKSIFKTVENAYKDGTSKDVYFLIESEKRTQNYVATVDVVPDNRHGPNGCLVTLFNSNDLSEKGGSSKDTMDKMKILSGSIANVIEPILEHIGTGGNMLSEEDVEQLRSVYDFARYQRRISSRSPEWQRLDRMVDKDVEGLTVLTDIGPVNILADESFRHIFTFLMNYSKKLGATEVKIKVKICNGKFTIVYSDNGQGVSRSLKMLMFSGRTNLGLWTLLISQVIRACGFRIEENGVFGEGMNVEIEIPSSSYSIGDL